MIKRTDGVYSRSRRPRSRSLAVKAACVNGDQKTDRLDLTQHQGSPCTITVAGFPDVPLSSGGLKLEPSGATGRAGADDLSIGVLFGLHETIYIRTSAMNAAHKAKNDIRLQHVQPLSNLRLAGARISHKSREITTCSAEKSLQLVVSILGILFISSVAFADEFRIAGTSAQEQAGGVFEKTTKEQPWQNSLGMKFVPVSGTQVLFSVWDTRVQDFRAFVENADYDATDGMWSLGEDGWQQRGDTWKDPGFKQGTTDPVVGVSWDDAKAFCEWLTKRERASGALPEGMRYRLPTDQEWSVAVGLDSEPGNTPQEKNFKRKLYAWGAKWPPPAGVGNYCGEESRIGSEPSKWTVIQGYNDGYPRTSPVGSFPANKNGLYDMAGNVWQWCEDWYNSENTHRVLRGASWDSHNPSFLLASSRDYITPDYRGAFAGFRCVLDREPAGQPNATPSSPQ